ncbi:hypothetical protein EDD29_5913 [Actinocorallia herbida]|uniref:MYXO-CTERM domain-containing protein n=1 Tax=Actinocorallia herbida TaxID=58109 RepID=A0A3N1D425_9ACTN|nr:hypothetical protein [Actinocorallia herbida]ROO88250.1 hypothetical protein EDD29_5913 [Actinocorallia herbida]
MRGAVLGLAVGGFLLLAAPPAWADGGLEVNPSNAKRGQTVGISTADNCRETDGQASVASSAFDTVDTTVAQGEANVAVAISQDASFETHMITLTCAPSQRKIEGAVTVKRAKSSSPDGDRCYQDEWGQWHGKCSQQGPETGFGGSVGSGPTALGVAGIGLVGAAGALYAVQRARRARA